MTLAKIGRFRIEDGSRLGDVSGCPAFDERLQRRVLLRPAHAGQRLTSERRAALEERARAAAALDHPAIVRVHDVVTIDDVDYLVVEYVEGEFLADLIAGGRLTPADRLLIGARIAGGLAAAHAAGLVHGRLTASNVVVTADGQAKILGLATPDDPAAPAADAQTENIALTGLLDALLTGPPPGASTQAAGARLLSGVPTQVNELVSTMSEAAAAGSPMAAAEIAAALTGQHDALTLSTAVAKVSRRRRYVIAACLGVVAAAVAGWLLWRSEPEPLYVAVRRPVVEGADPTEALAQAAAGVRVAAINTLGGLVNTYALEPRDVDEVSGGATKVAHAMAADEVLEATVTGAGTTGRVTLRRLSGADGAELWRSAFDVPLDNMQLLVETSTSHVHRGYTDRPSRRGAFATTASPEGYAAYLKVYRVYEDRQAGQIDWEQILRDLESCRRSSPGLLETSKLEAHVAAYLYRSRRETRFLDHARKVADHLIRIAPAEPAALSSAISVAFSTGNLDRATALVAELERLVPMYPSLPWLRARVADARDDRKYAIELMRRAIVRRPSANNLAFLGRMELREGLVAEARRHLLQALELEPQKALALCMLAELELLHGPPERAEELYLRLNALSPTPGRQTNLGVAQLLLGRYREAASRFERLLDRRSRHPTDLLNLADCHYLMGDVDTARPLYREAVDKFEGFGDNITPEQLGIMAQARLGVGDPTAAVSTIQEALRRAPRSPDVNFYAALVHAAVGDTSSALACVQSAVDLGINPHWFRLAWFDGLRSDARFVEITQTVHEPNRHTAAHASP